VKSSGSAAAWASQHACDMIAYALSQMYQQGGACAEAADYILAGGYSLNMDPFTTDYGWSYDNNSYAQWLGYSAFDDQYELVITMAHEVYHNWYGPNNDTDADNFGQSCIPL
jgi:hypothetical protein